MVVLRGEGCRHSVDEKLIRTLPQVLTMAVALSLND